MIVFVLDGRRYALHLSDVEQVVRVVEITGLPKAPPIVLGVINVHGAVVPVVDVRQRFGLPPRELVLSDQLIIARAGSQTMALIVDSVDGVAEYESDQVTPVEDFLPQAEYVEGAIRLQDGLVLIHDLETFLSLEEEQHLQEAMKG